MPEPTHPSDRPRPAVRILELALLALLLAATACRSREEIVADCLARYRPVHWANVSRNGDYGTRYSWSTSTPRRSPATFPPDAPRR